LLLILSNLALAAAPDALVARLELSGGDAHGLVESEDGRFVGFVDGTALAVLDVDRWSFATAAPCQVAGLAFGDLSAGSRTLYAACADGTVVSLELGDDALDQLAAPSVISRWDTGDDSTLGVWWDASGGRLVALGKGNDVASDLLTVHGLDPADSTQVDYTALPAAALVRRGFNDAVLQRGRLLISHGGDDVSTLVLGSSVAGTSSPMGISAGDIAPWSLDDLIAVDSRQIARFTPTTSTIGTGQWVSFLSPLTDPAAVTAGSTWVAVADAVELGFFDASTGLPVVPAASAVTLDAGLTDLLALADDTVLGLADSGELLVFSAVPWIDAATATPTTGGSGAVVNLSFQVSRTADWDVYLGGDREGTGSRLASGQASAGELVSVPLTLDTDWAEGANALYILAGSGTNVGHARVDVSKDDVPDAPVLTSASVGFANGALRLTFDGITAEDLDHYDVFVSREHFSPSDYATGGPQYNVDGGEFPDDVSGPVTVADVSPGARVITDIAPLTNGTTYYVAVRAYDRGGKESAMSEVVSQIPELTMPPSQAAGEPGGPLCAPTSPRQIGWLAPLLLLWRRRRVVAAAALVAAPMSASAFELPKDETGHTGSFEAHWGSLSFPRDASGNATAALDHAYGSANGTMDGIFLEASPSAWQIAELNFGLGLSAKTGNQLGTDSGLPSADTAKLSWADFALGGTLRLQVLDEQPIVPFASIGWHHLIWREGWDNGTAADSTKLFHPGNRDHVAGAFRGRHTSLGFDVLLDLFAPGRASLLEAQTGINDTFLTIEWRKQDIANRVGDAEPAAGQSGYDFSGNVWSVGLKLDF